MLHLVWIVPLALLIFYIASPRQRGDIAPSRVRRILAQGLDRGRYTVLNDLVIPAVSGTVSMDHAVVSRFGVFVIRSVYAAGLVAVDDRGARVDVARRIVRLSARIGRINVST